MKNLFSKLKAKADKVQCPSLQWWSIVAVSAFITYHVKHYLIH